MQSRIQRQAFADRLATLFGFDTAKAARYANLIGDTHELDAQENLIVRDLDNTIIDRLPSSRFSETAVPSPA